MTQERNVIPLIMVITIFLCSIIGGTIMFWIAFALCATVLVLRNMSISGRKQSMYCIFLLLHVAALVYHMTGNTFPMSGGDWPVFVWNAQRILERTDSVIGIFNFFDSRLIGDLYERLCAYIYYCFGYNQKYMYAVSFIAGEIVYYGIYQISRIITKNHESNAILASLIFYVTPLEIIYSVDFLREMLLQAIVVNACYCLFHYLTDHNMYKCVCGIFLSVLASLVHSGYVSLIIAFFACVVLEDKQQRKIKFSPVRIATVFTGVILLYLSPAWTYIASRFSNISSLTELAEASSSPYAGMANTTYIGTPGNSLGVVLQTPLRFFYYLVSPLPWQVRSFGTFVAMILDSTIRWLIFYRFAAILSNRQIIWNLENNQSLVFQASIIIIIITTLIFSWGTSNYGTAMRHRTSLYSLEIIIAFTLWNERFLMDGRIRKDQSKSKYLKY